MQVQVIICCVVQDYQMEYSCCLQLIIYFQIITLELNITKRGTYIIFKRSDCNSIIIERMHFAHIIFSLKPILSSY